MTTPNLTLEPLVSAQAQKHVTVNEAFARIDAATQLAVLDRDAPDPPASPGDGDRYLVPSGATGAWSGRDGTIAAWEDATLGWLFLAPRIGWRLWLIDEGKFVVFTDAGWQDVGGGSASVNPATDGLVGVNTTADVTNRLSVKSDAVLLSHDDVTPGTGGMQLKFNKATATDTASLLYQTGFSGRAEFGLAGSDDFSIKVSPDGAGFLPAMQIDRTTAKVSFPSTSLSAILRAETGPSVVARRYVAEAPWIASVNAADEEWLSVCWSPDLALFCAVAFSGAGNRVMTSPDGIAWTIRGSAADINWSSVCWSSELGLFCAVANNGTDERVMTSPDGIAWTLRTAASSNAWRSVCWSPDLGLFCAVANSGTGNRVMTSPDGIAWTSRGSAADHAWFGLCWSSDLGLFCAVAFGGTINRVMTSPDGIAWTLRTAASANNWRSVCWSAELGLFCAVANSGTDDRVMTSPDGIAWTSRDSAADNGWYGVCWSAELGLFCAVAPGGTINRVMTSQDGIVWTLRTAASANAWRSVCWSPDLGLFCAVANSGAGDRVMTSVSAYSYPYRS